MIRKSIGFRTNTVGVAVAAVALVGLFVLTTGARAWTVAGDGTTLTVSADSGEANYITLSDSGDNFLVTDNNGYAFAGSLPAGCLSILTNRISCSTLGITTITVLAGDFDDQVSDSSSVLAAELDGGEGADILSGGNGTDVLIGAEGNDQLSGGAEDDEIDAGDGDDTVNGGDGNDQVITDDGDDSIDGALRKLKIKTGKIRSIQLRLPKRVFKALKRARKKGLTLTTDLTLRDAAGRTSITQKTFNLRYVRRHRRG